MSTRSGETPPPDGLRRVGLGSRHYPPWLAQIHDPPSGLWVRGQAPLELLSQPAIAIVGARACTQYGRGVARSIAREVSAAGLVVVSGLARGIDGEAHRGAVDVGGATVAVLGCGIDRDYPAAHAELARRIVACGGLIVSEYEPGVEPAPWRFPARNRIISGLTRAAVIVEARERSGALITADHALEQGREVLAVPGEITSAASAGSNGLLRQGATPVTRVGDILEALGVEPEVRTEPTRSETEQTVLAILASGPAGTDELVTRTGLDAGVVAAVLASLELDGTVTGGEGVFRTTIPK